MDWIGSEAELETHYGQPKPPSTVKVADRITPAYRPWLEAARFCVLSTVGPEGTDASPRGDDGPVVTMLDERTLALPDWRGNDRIDSLRNIVRDGRVSLMLMVPGETNVIRINGTARLTADAGLSARFAAKGTQPRTVAVIAVAEVYFQCARALMRSQLWEPAGDRPALPSPGQILAAQSAGEVGGDDYDRSWPDRERGIGRQPCRAQPVGDRQAFRAGFRHVLRAQPSRIGVAAEAARAEADAFLVLEGQNLQRHVRHGAAVVQRLHGLDGSQDAQRAVEAAGIAHRVEMRAERQNGAVARRAAGIGSDQVAGGIADGVHARLAHPAEDHLRRLPLGGAERQAGQAVRLVGDPGQRVDARQDPGDGRVSGVRHPRRRGPG